MTASYRRGQCMTGGFLILPGLGAIGSGLYCLIEGLRAAALTARAGERPSTDADILGVSKDIRFSSHGLKRVRLVCTYRYSWQGHVYIGNCIDLSGLRPDIGNSQEELFQNLSQAQTTRTPVPCYVDPEEPSRAALCRAFRACDLWCRF